MTCYSVNAFLGDTKESIDLSIQPFPCIPGQKLSSSSFDALKLHGSVQLGPGISTKRGRVDSNNSDEVLYAIASGILKYKAPNRYWIESNVKYYTPVEGDQIVGIIEEKCSECYKINISSCSSSALLSKLAFEGATKRNKPELKRGDIVYARILQSNKDFDTFATCIPSSGTKKEWSTGETIYGELRGGALVKLSINKARQMLLPSNAILKLLGKHFSFEVAIGMNGFVWINSSDLKTTILIRNILLNAELLNDDIQVEVMMEQVIRMHKKR